MSNDGIRNKFKYERMYQDLLRGQIRSKLEEIKTYYQALEYKFKNDKKLLSDRYEREIANKKISSEMLEGINDYFSEENYTIEELFIKNFRYSIIVTIYSTLETTLSDLCHYLRNTKKISLALDDIKGEGIERSKLYLQKVCVIDFPESSHE
ncbi:MAG: hypothetical protein ABSE54_08775 [Smithella sp.]|jgi:hypothetical protein